MKTDEDIREAVRRAAGDGRIACARALALAEELDVPPARIGEACNREGIKIAHCQLGCFP